MHIVLGEIITSIFFKITYKKNTSNCFKIMYNENLLSLREFVQLNS